MVPMQEVKGFSTTYIPRKGDKVISILIYLDDNQKIEMFYTHYFNFDGIKPALVESEYLFLGVERMRRKWIFFGKRVYRFEP